MPRKRDPRRDEALQLWKEHHGDITNRAIAEQLNVPEKTVSNWKSRDKWNVVLQSAERSTTNRRVAKKARAPSKRSGNPHPVKEFTKRNKAAEKFGFFSKYMPDESLEIMQEIQDRTPADMIWDQIMIQYTAIIRAQKIMNVLDHDDMTKEENMSMHSESHRQTTSTSSDSETEQHGYLIQFAWDKQANFLMAQTKAMAELRNLIKQFVAIADEADERRKKLELMQAQIDKVKAETTRMTGDSQGDYESDGFMDALDGKTDEVWDNGDSDD